MVAKDKLTNHPKGVQSSAQQDVVIQETKEKVGVNMSIIETVNVYDDVVLLLAGEAVPVVPEVEGTHSVYVEQVVEQPDEVQTAISSIVEIEQTQ